MDDSAQTDAFLDGEGQVTASSRSAIFAAADLPHQSRGPNEKLTVDLGDVSTDGDGSAAIMDEARVLGAPEVSLRAVFHAVELREAALDVVDRGRRGRRLALHDIIAIRIVAVAGVGGAKVVRVWSAIWPDERGRIVAVLSRCVGALRQSELVALAQTLVGLHSKRISGSGSDARAAISRRTLKKTARRARMSVGPSELYRLGICVDGGRGLM
jgi:hypothetical protein